MFSVKLVNEDGISKNINDGESYVIVGMTGLTPPSANHYTSKSHNKHGVKYNGYSIDERTITISIKLLGDVEENRNALYNWIESGQYVKIHYSNGVRNVYCEGHVVVPDADFFTDNEIIELEVMCPDPYFKSFESIIAEVDNVEPMFYFTEEDDDVYFATEEEGVPFSEESNSNLTTIINNGSESGVLITVLALDDITTLEIYNGENPATEFIKLKSGKTLRKGQKLVIDTTGVRNKITIDGENALSSFGRNITWFKLKKGRNSFYTEPAVNMSKMRMTIEYNERWLGV